MKIKPKLAYRNPCIPINQMNTNKVYEAVPATNQPNWKEKGLIFAGGHLLAGGEYTIVEGYLPTDIANYTLEELVELLVQAIAKGAK